MTPRTLLSLPLLLALCGPTLRGDPTFRWLEPWTINIVSLSLPFGFDDETRARGSALPVDFFRGGSLTVSGYVENDLEPVGAFSSVLLDIEFSRRFELAGSPQGWYVKTDLAVEGVLDSNDFDTTDTLDSEFQIDGNFPLFVFRILRGDKELEVNKALSVTQTYRNGIYTAHGFLELDANTFVTADLGAVGFLDFEDTMRVQLVATPVPEPTNSILLLSSGWLCILVLRRLRRRAASE